MKAISTHGRVDVVVEVAIDAKQDKDSSDPEKSRDANPRVDERPSRGKSDQRE